jgi:hypothetical protein
MAFNPNFSSLGGQGATESQSGFQNRNKDWYDQAMQYAGGLGDADKYRFLAQSPSLQNMAGVSADWINSYGNNPASVGVWNGAPTGAGAQQSGNTGNMTGASGTAPPMPPPSPMQGAPMQPPRMPPPSPMSGPMGGPMMPPSSPMSGGMAFAGGSPRFNEQTGAYGNMPSNLTPYSSPQQKMGGGGMQQNGMRQQMAMALRQRMTARR